MLIRAFDFNLEFTDTTGTFTALNTETSGDSTLFYGSSDNDSYTTGAGDDVLHGSAGDDVLTGGLGNDWFVFNTGDGNDTIEDFTPGEDKLILESGLTIENISEQDNDLDGVLDTLLTLSSGDSINLSGTAGIVDADILTLASLDNAQETSHLQVQQQEYAVSHDSMGIGGKGFENGDDLLA